MARPKKEKTEPLKELKLRIPKSKWQLIVDAANEESRSVPKQGILYLYEGMDRHTFPVRK